MANKLLWKIIILAGLLPFVVPIFSGISAATMEFSSKFDYPVFVNQIITYSVEHWLTYIMGILLILISIKHLKVN